MRDSHRQYQLRHIVLLPPFFASPLSLLCPTCPFDKRSTVACPSSTVRTPELGKLSKKIRTNAQGPLSPLCARPTALLIGRKPASLKTSYSPSGRLDSTLPPQYGYTSAPLPSCPLLLCRMLLTLYSSCCHSCWSRTIPLLLCRLTPPVPVLYSCPSDAHPLVSTFTEQAPGVAAKHAP